MHLFAHKNNIASYLTRALLILAFFTAPHSAFAFDVNDFNTLARDTGKGFIDTFTLPLNFIVDSAIDYAHFTVKVGETIAQNTIDTAQSSADLYRGVYAFVSAPVIDTTHTFASTARTFAGNVREGATYAVASKTQTASVWSAVQDFWNNLFNTPAPQTVTPPSFGGPASKSASKPPTVVTPQSTTPPTPTTINRTVVNQPVITRTIEHTTERVLSGVTATDLASQIAALRSDLLTEIAKGKTQAVADNNALYLAMAPMNRINNLSSVTISNPTITGASITSGTLSGSFSGSVAGSTGSFDTLGVGTSTPADTLAVNGVTYLAQVSTPAVTTNRLYNTGGNLYWGGSVIGGGGVGSWTLNGSDVTWTTGNVGIGTTSPYAALSVVGNSVLGTITSGVWNGTAITAPYINFGTGAGQVSATTIPTTDTGNYYTGSTANVDAYLQNLGQQRSERWSTGLVSGGVISAASTNHINITAGVGYVGTTRVTWGALTAVTMLYSGDNWVAIDSTGAVNIATTQQNTDNYIILGYVYTTAGNTAVGVASSLPYYTGNYASRNTHFVNHSIGAIVESGNIVSQTTPLALIATGGTINANLKEFTAVDTTTFTKWYNSADNGWVTDTADNLVNTTKYNVTTNNQATALVTMTVSYWKKDLILRTLDGALHYIYGQAQYATEQAAKDGALPSIPSAISSGGSTYLATAVVQNGDATLATRLYDVRPNLARVFGFGTSGTTGSVANHSLLSNLTADDHPQYVLTNGNRLMTGNLQLNTNAITGATAITMAGLLQNTLTTEQMRLRYDASNYTSFTVGSTGALTIGTTGTGTTTLTNGVNVGAGNGYFVGGAGAVSGAPGALTSFGFSNTLSSSGQAFGNFNTISNIASLAFGNSNTTSGAFGVAFGYNNIASNSNSVALGSSNTASGLSSVAIGRGITNTTANSLMIGPSDAAKLTILGATGSVGFVGIGTTTPAGNLTIAGTAGQTANLFNIASSTGANVFVINPAGSVRVTPVGLQNDASGSSFSVTSTRISDPLAQSSYSAPTRNISSALTITPTVDDQGYFAGNHSNVNVTGNLASYTGSVAGSASYVANGKTAGTLTEMFGNYNFVKNSGSASTTSMTGVYSEISNVNLTAGTVTNAYGFYGKIAGAFSFPNTITNGYGLYLNVSDVNITNPYAIYTASTAKSYFGGNVGIGTTSPYAALSVVGASGVVADVFNATSLTGYQQGGSTLLTASSTGFSTFLGFGAGTSTTSGNSNTFIGYQVGQANTTGNLNTGIGFKSLFSNTTGNWNTATGYYALNANTTGTHNSAYGNNALLLSTGTQNSAFGFGSLRSNTTGNDNTSMGYNSGFANTTGTFNTFLGMNAGNTDGTVTTGAALTNATAIGYNAQVATNNSLILGGTGAYGVNVGIGTTSPYAKLSVVGNVVADSFNATSTTATSTFTAGVKVGVGNGYWIGNANVLTTNATAVSNNIVSGVVGNLAIGIGNVATSSATPGVALGTSNIVNSTLGGSAVGISNTASDYLASAFGAGNRAQNQESSAFGRLNIAAGWQTVALGYGNNAQVDSAVAVGSNNIASGAGSGALGFGIGNTAAGDGSAAIGYGNTAAGDGSAAIGDGNISSGYGSSAFGNTNTASGLFSSVFGFTASATSTSDSAFGYIVKAGGGNSVALGNGVSAFAASSIAIGKGVTNTTANSLQIGPSDTAKLTILSSGYMGIGTTTPYSKLSVWSGGTTTGRAFSVVNNASTTLMQILDNGNVGIGTTSPYAKLSVVGNVVADSFNATSSVGYKLNGTTLLTASPTLFNTFVGLGAGTSTVAGSNNTFTGYQSGQANNNGYYNTAYGALALYSNISASFNTAIGEESLYSNINGTNNAANGDSSLYYNTSGSFNTANGSLALVTNTTGSANTSVGYYSLGNNTTGTSSVAVGDHAGYLNTTGYQNTFLGAGAGYTDGTTNTLGTLFNATAIGYNAQVRQSNSLILGGTGTYAVKVGIGTTTPFSTLTVATGNIGAFNGALCADNGGLAKCYGALTAGVVYGDSSSFVASDVAENYPVADLSLEAGDIVMVSATLTAEEQIKRAQDKEKLNTLYQGETPASIKESLSASVEKATSDGGYKIVGVISTTPGVLLGDTTGLNLNTTFKPVALSGRVPVKVNNEGGDIKTGDPVALSSMSGIGTKAATSSRAFIGTALEDFSGATGKIMVFMNLSSARLDPAISKGTIVTGRGESSFWDVEDITGRIKFISAGIDLNGQDIVGVRSIIGSAGWSIDAFGRMVVEELKTNKLCVGETCVDESMLKKILEKGGLGTPTSDPVATVPEPMPTPAPVISAESIAQPDPTPATETSAPKEPAPEPKSTPIPEPAP